MLDQLNFDGKNKVEVAIQRLQLFEPPEGYHIAFSGGKDSVVIKALADMAGVKYDAHYNITSVDPPELVRFIKDKHPDVSMDYPRDKNGKVITMWNLIPRKLMPPTHIARYCCKELKESGGKGRFTVTGVRWAESTRRKISRAGVELNFGAGKENKIICDPDNPEDSKMARFCPTKGKRVINPIIDWEDEDVWEFIKKYNIPYCSLYDEGFHRLGCIGCPMNSQRERGFERWPKYKDHYLRAFDRMIEALKEHGKTSDKWQTAEDVMKWWLGK